MFRNPIERLLNGVFGRVVTYRKTDGTTAQIKCHIRGMRSEEIVGGYRETDLFMVVPAGNVGDAPPRKFELITTADGEVYVVMADFRRAYGVAGELVSFKGYIRGQT